jgi:hypothetical protein
MPPFPAFVDLPKTLRLQVNFKSSIFSLAEIVLGFSGRASQANFDVAATKAVL